MIHQRDGRTKLESLHVSTPRNTMQACNRMVGTGQPQTQQRHEWCDMWASAALRLPAFHSAPSGAAPHHQLSIDRNSNTCEHFAGASSDDASDEGNTPGNPKDAVVHAGSSKDSVIVFPRKSNKQPGHSGEQGGVVELSLDCLRPMFRMRQADAAKALGIASSTLKHVCRQLGIQRWPWRSEQKSGRPRAEKQGSFWAAAQTKSKSECVRTGIQRAGGSALNIPWKIPLHAMSIDAQRLHQQVMQMQERARSSCQKPLHAVRLTVAEPGMDSDNESSCSVTPFLRVGQAHNMWFKIDANSSGLLEEALESL